MENIDTFKNNVEKHIRDSWEPFAEECRKGGTSEGAISRVRLLMSESRSRHFYDRYPFYTLYQCLISSIFKRRSDSKAEMILLMMMYDARIKFEFQKQISEYRVDFGFFGDIVLECDGPHHEMQKEQDLIRDMRLEKLGYRVLRYTWNDIAQIPDKFIFELKALVDQ